MLKIQKILGEAPTPLQQGWGNTPPLSCSPPLVPFALDGFLQRTTFKKAATALFTHTHTHTMSMVPPLWQCLLCPHEKLTGHQQTIIRLIHSTRHISPFCSTYFDTRQLPSNVHKSLMDPRIQVKLDNLSEVRKCYFTNIIALELHRIRN